MKRLLTIGLMLAAALALTNCVDQFETPIQESDIIVDETTILQGEGEPFEVFVETAETKLQYQNDRYYWESATDKISLYSNPSENKNQVTAHGSFTYDGNGKFVGNLNGALANYNDWYCVYPSSAGVSNLSSHKITIGSSSNSDGICTLSQEGNSKSHIAGPDYPMYGIKNNVSKDKAPRFHISPMYSLVALKFVNQGDGKADSDPDVVINNVTFTAPEEVFGNFNVNILEDFNDKSTFTTINGESFKAAKVTFKNSDGSAKNLAIPTTQNRVVYFAVKPFDPAGKDIKISVNGSTKTFKLPSNVKFEAGKQITLEIPISHVKGTKVTDALDKGTNGIFGIGAKKYFDFGNFKTPSTKKINGENVSVYTIGSQDNGGTITIKGTANELIKLLPASFYAASYGNKQAIMRVSGIKASIWVVLTTIDIDLGYSQLATMAPLNLINFTGLVPLTPSVSDAESTGNIILMDEEPYHKGLTEEAINNLLARFDTYPNDPYDNLVPTFEGLRNAMSSNWTDAAHTTMDIIFEKAKYSLQNNTNDKIAAVKSLLEIGYQTVCAALNAVSITVTLSTVDANTSINLGTSANPNIITATDGRVVVWGIDMKD